MYSKVQVTECHFRPLRRERPSSCYSLEIGGSEENEPGYTQIVSFI